MGYAKIIVLLDKFIIKHYNIFMIFTPGICSNCNKYAKRIIETTCGNICRPCYYRYDRYGDPNHPNQRNNDDITTPLTDYQQQILLGCMLGDGSISKSTYSKNAVFGTEHMAKDKEYVRYLYSIFQNFCSDKGYSERTRTDNRFDPPRIRYATSFHTRSIPALLPHYHRWHKNGKKIVPKDLTATELTSVACAVWFADDGCVLNSRTNVLRINLSTDGFAHDEVIFLAKLLQDILNSELKIYEHGKNTNQYIIGMNTRTASKFIQYIDKEFVKLNMSRKSDIWKNMDFTIFNNSKFNTHIDNNRIKNSILEIGKKLISFTYKDIEQELKPTIKRKSLKRYLEILVEDNKLSKIGGNHNKANSYSVL
jgi:hypothetical protein